MLRVDRIFCITREADTSGILRHAALLAGSFGAELHVMPAASSRGLDPGQRLGRQGEEGLTPDEVVIVDPADDSTPIVHTIQRHVGAADVDLLITGPQATQGAAPPLAECSSEALAKQLDCPLLYAATRGGGAGQVRRLLVPSDLSNPSLGALRHAVGLAHPYDAEVVLLHVIEQSPYVALTPTDRLSLSGPTLPELRARRRLEAMIQTARRAGVSIQAHLEFGDPIRQIGRVVDQQEIDLVVLSSHGATAQSRRSLGDVALKTLRRVAAPFFLVRTFGRSLLPDQEGAT